MMILKILNNGELTITQEGELPQPNSSELRVVASDDDRKATVHYDKLRERKK